VCTLFQAEDARENPDAGGSLGLVGAVLLALHASYHTMSCLITDSLYVFYCGLCLCGLASRPLSSRYKNGTRGPGGAHA
jgi:hypothetical protein